MVLRVFVKPPLFAVTPRDSNGGEGKYSHLPLRTPSSTLRRPSPLYFPSNNNKICFEQDLNKVYVKCLAYLYTKEAATFFTTNIILSIAG